MPELSYLDFDLSIEGTEGVYLARVLDSPAGQAEAAFSNPFSAQDLEILTLRVGRPRSGTRRLDSPEMQTAKKYGARLFEAVFGDEVYACFRSGLAAAQKDGKGLRIRLWVDAPELTNLPWEYLYDPHQHQQEFLSLSVATPIVRYLDLPQPPSAMTVSLPIKVLVMISSPSDYPSLDVEAEWRKLQGALQPLQERGLVQLERLERATLAALQGRLRQGEYHVFHFIGHGIFDEREQDGLLLFEDENERGRALSGLYLGTLLRDHRSLRLAVLNACEGARTSQTDPFAGVAHSLVLRGIPAVIAMQYEITDQAAITFAQEFYAAIADGYPVDAALAEFRKAIFAQENDIEWGTPVYFTRTPHGRVFEIQSTSPGRPIEPASTPVDDGSEDTHLEQMDAGIALQETEKRLALPALLQRLPTWARVSGVAGFMVILIAVGIMIARSVGLIGGVGIGTPTPEPSASVTLEATDAPNSTQTVDQGVQMALIPAGPFEMGSESGASDEIPVRTVYVDDFYIDIYEVTNALYAECVDAGVCNPPSKTSSNTRSSYYGNSEYDDYPVIYVSWEDANTYCIWRQARLPTEAEWEKAARGGLEGALYPWGDDEPVCDVGATNGANFENCASGDTMKVGSFSPNGYGLYDMAGNVWEWVVDWYDVYPGGDPNASEDFGQTHRLHRSGGWDFDDRALRVANRYHDLPSDTYDGLGIRCARSLGSTP